MTSTTTGFVHLHAHSDHSSLDGKIGLEAGVRKVALDNNPALAFTDHGNGSAAWKFSQIARENGIKPIIGLEAYIAISDDWRVEPDRTHPGSVEVDREDETEGEVDDDEEGKVADVKRAKKKHYQHITLLARNAKGWENLTRMMNEATTTYWSRYPMMDFALIKEFGEGVIALTGCLGGPVLGPISRGHDDEARRNLERIIDAVGKDNVYVEIMEHGIAPETAALPKMAALAEEFGLKLVATNDAHYVDETDAEDHEAWLAVRSTTVLSDPKRFHFHGSGFHLRTEAEMRELRTEDWWQEAVSNTLIVASRCEDVIPQPGMFLPEFGTPDGYTDSRAFLIAKVQDNARKLYGFPLPAVVKARLQTELKIITDMGFIDYFLIVDDVISWSRANGIRVGPGRGSAAGSLISYCLGIVRVDPLENNLLFERFLEPGRKGMPDIDVDFEKARRHEVLTYLADRWGRDKVARIGSFSAHKTKRALRDAAKVLEAPSSLGDTLSKAVPIGEGGAPWSIDKLEDPKESGGELFRSIVEKNGELAVRVVQLARAFSDTINGESIHACGTLISNQDLSGLIPMRRDRSKSNTSGLSMVTQWDGKDIDEFGMLKLDVLGLRNLDIVSKAAKFIEETTGIVIDPDDLPHPNTKGNPMVNKTWELLRSGRTAGVFQMESDGMAKLAQGIQPDCLADLSAIVALYRPGPMSAGMHDAYAERKAGTQMVDYSHWTRNIAEQDAIASVLGETYGVFVFQEQLMRLGTVVAGFDAAGRSVLRKAVGKKNKLAMAKVGAALIEGAEKEFRDESTGEIISMVFAKETAERLYESMKGSAEYLFNASHSYAYAQLAYVTAYLKANWPAQYGAAILAITDKEDKRQLALRALREEGIDVLAPDVNLSRGETYPIGERTVILGLSEIKGVSQAGSDIASNRLAAGEFTSIHHMLLRVLNSDGKPAIDVGSLEGLISAGALDAFGPRLGMMRVARSMKIAEIDIPQDEWGILERSTRQRQVLGAVMGVYPMEALEPELRAWISPPMTTRHGEEAGQPAVFLEEIVAKDGGGTRAMGILAEWSERSYKGGQMVNFTLETQKISIRCVAWDATVKAIRASPSGIPAVGSILAVAGRVSIRTNEIEDEDGLVIDTVITKEINVQQIFPVDVEDGATAFAPEAIRMPLREHLTVVVGVDPDDDDTFPDGDADATPKTALAVVTNIEDVREKSGRAIPVVGRAIQQNPAYPWSFHKNADALRRTLRNAGDSLSYYPEPAKVAAPGVSRVFENGRCIMIVVDLFDKYEEDPLPASWAPYADGSLPDWEAFVDPMHPNYLSGKSDEAEPTVDEIPAPVAQLPVAEIAVKPAAAPIAAAIPTVSESVPAAAPVAASAAVTKQPIPKAREQVAPPEFDISPEQALPWTAPDPVEPPIAAPILLPVRETQVPLIPITFTANELNFG